MQQIIVENKNLKVFSRNLTKGENILKLKAKQEMEHQTGEDVQKLQKIFTASLKKSIKNKQAITDK